MYLRVSLFWLISAGIYFDPRVRCTYNQKFMTFATVRCTTENYDEFIFIECNSAFRVCWKLAVVTRIVDCFAFEHISTWWSTRRFTFLSVRREKNNDRKSLRNQYEWIDNTVMIITMFGRGNKWNEMNANCPLFRLERNYNFHYSCHEGTRNIAKLLCGLTSRFLLYCFMIVIRCFARPLNGRYNDDFQFCRQLRTMFFSLSLLCKWLCRWVVAQSRHSSVSNQLIAIAVKMAYVRRKCGVGNE